jgi:glycosyltransferase involved in cell wall biosynthesis
VTHQSPRYLLLINSLAPGGAERSLVELLAPLTERGVSPIVLCLKRSEVGFEQEVIDAGFDLRFVKATRLPGRVLEVRSTIRAERPALVHTTLFDGDIVGRLAAIGTGVPVITTLANTTYDPARLEGDANLTKLKIDAVKAIDRWTARHLTRHFHAVSSAVKASAVAHLGIDPDDVTVVRRGRDPDRLGLRSEARRAAVRKRMGFGEEAEVVLTVGRHEFQKGQSHLLTAFSRVSRQRPSAVLVIAGRDGNASRSLHALASELGVVDRVHFLGHRSDVADLMVAADVFVFPSLWEGLGGVLIEALALEVPIVSSDLDATREVLGGEGTCGLLVPPGDGTKLAVTLEAVLSDAGLRRRIVADSRRRFESAFMLADRSAELIDLMISVANE